MKKTALLILFVALMAIIPMTGFAAETTVEGTIQGFTCVTTGNTCPVGKEDALASRETVFVLLKELPNDYYFLPNAKSAAMARHINDKVRVTGTVNKTHRTIHASAVELFKNGQWVLVWGKTMQQELDEWEKKITEGL